MGSRRLGEREYGNDRGLSGSFGLWYGRNT